MRRYLSATAARPVVVEIDETTELAEGGLALVGHVTLGGPREAVAAAMAAADRCLYARPREGESYLAFLLPGAGSTDGTPQLIFGQPWSLVHLSPDGSIPFPWGDMSLDQLLALVGPT